MLEDRHIEVSQLVEPDQIRGGECSAMWECGMNVVISPGDALKDVLGNRLISDLVADGRKPVLPAVSGVHLRSNVWDVDGRQHVDISGPPVAQVDDVRDL